MFDSVTASDLYEGATFIEDCYPEVYKVVRFEGATVFACEVGLETRDGFVHHLKPHGETAFFGMGGAYGPTLYMVDFPKDVGDES